MSESANKMVARIESWRWSDIQPPGWSIYGSEPVTDKTINAAIEVAKQIAGKQINGRVIKYVAPTSSGGIKFSDSDESVCIEVSTYVEVSEIEAGEGWRLLGPDEVIKKGDEVCPLFSFIWSEVPEQFIGKENQVSQIRRRIPAKPEPLEIDGYEVSLDNGFPRIASLLGTQKMYFSSRPKAIRQLIAWLQQVADWREAQDAAK